MKNGLVSKIRQIFLLTQTKLMASVVLALIIFLVEFSKIILQSFESGSGTPVGTTGTTISDNVLNILHDISALPNAEDVVTALFWAVTAVVVFSIGVAIKNIITSIENEIAADLNAPKKSIPKLLITRFSEKILAAASFAALSAISILILIPYWMDLLRIFAFSNFDIGHGLYFLAGFTGLVATIYIVWVAAYFIWIYEESVE